MAKNLVLRSIETDDGGRCVDIFRRPDGSCGFEEYRRDHEDPSGWGGAVGFAGRRFDDANAAIHAAIGVVSWLDASLGQVDRG